MTMHHIIEQVDAYLALLHQAREILLADVTPMRTTKMTRAKSAVWHNSKRLRKSSGQPASDIFDASQDSEVNRKASRKRGVSSIPPMAPSTILIQADPTATMSPNEGHPVSEIVKTEPTKRRTTFNRFASGQPQKSAKSEPKPATALSHPIRSDVVVVSAEQLRAERERQLRPMVAQPRSLRPSATGRLAFEALFGR